MSGPRHTVIVPTYNQEQYLGAALDSIIAQDDPSWEAIVVNDGSTDNTAAIIDEYARRDARIIPVHKANGGVGSALNVGLKRARGTWLHWLSSDDLFESDKLAVNNRWINDHPQCNFFFSYFTLLREATGVLERRELWGPVPDPEHQILAAFYRNCISGISICVNREAWQSAGFFDESLRYAQDFDQWLRLLKANKAIFIPEWTVVNRNHALQGSEVFPDACYFETALACIRFINVASFQEMVPWADLSNLATARSAIHKALDAAFERSSYLYCLGPHPALVLRVLEWVDTRAGRLGKILRPEIITRICAQAARTERDAWRATWQALAASLSNPDTRITYSPVDETDLIRRLYTNRDFVPGAIAAQAPSGAPTRVEKLRAQTIVIVLPRGCDEALRSTVRRVTRDLAQSGVRTVVFDDAHEGYAWLGLSVWLRRGRNDKDQFARLERADIVCTFGEKTPIWLEAENKVLIDPRDESWPVQLSRALDARVNDAGSNAISRRPVAFLQRVLHGGGAERVVLDIVSKFDRTRYKPYVLTLFECDVPPDYPADVQVFCVRDFPPKPPLAPVPPDATPQLPAPEAVAQPEPPATLHRSMMDSFDGHLPAAEGLQAVLAHLGPETALITVMEEGAVAAWIAQTGRPLKFIATLHCVESLFLPQLWPEASRREAQAWMLANACMAAEKVIFPTLGCKQDLVTNFGVSVAQVDVIGNPVDSARIRRLSLEPCEDEALVDEKRFTFVSLARLDPEKNHDLLLDACSELAAVRRDFTVLCIGTGSEEQRLKAEVAKRGLGDMVQFIGRRTNPFPLLRRAGALVLTSRLEAFALVLVEAMACGVPVVSVDCPHGPREVLEDGQAGLLISEDDASALSRAMLRLITDPALRDNLVERGYERLEAFDVGHIVGHWERAVDTLLPA